MDACPRGLTVPSSHGTVSVIQAAISNTTAPGGTNRGMFPEMNTRAHVALLLVALSAATTALAGDDGLRLTASRDGSGRVHLQWSGARPGFEVYRSTRADDVRSSFDHRIALTRDRSFVDDPPAGSIFFYEVGPRWPQFFSSDPTHDDLLNDMFIRHTRTDFADNSLRSAAWPVPTVGTGSVWRDWEIDEFLWHDASTINYPFEDRAANIAFWAAYFPVDRFGYHYSSGGDAEPPTAGPGCCAGMGWPFPTYTQSQGLTTGWEWNGSDREGWSMISTSRSQVTGGEWRASTTLKGPQLISPAIAIAAEQTPFVTFEIQYDAIDPLATGAERTFRFWWQTAAEPTWTAAKSVTSDSFPMLPLGPIQAGQTLRVVQLPLYLHNKWAGQTITRVRLDPLQSGAPRTASWRLNYLRLTYDTRHAINNPSFVRAVARKFFWDGDADYLKVELSRLRQATQFMLIHMQGDALGVLDNSWFAGHDGPGFTGPDQPRIGHGIGDNWHDLISLGPRDLFASLAFYLALQTMVQIEEFVAVNPQCDSPRPSVTGTDGTSVVPYVETAASLSARLPVVRQAINAQFWNPATGRYAGSRTASGELRDYGAIQPNAEALAAGIPDAEAARSILDWLDGTRLVADDTSIGTDIYVNRFGPRFTTRKNDFDYMWSWTGYTQPWGGWVEDGGASLLGTFRDLQGRLHWNDVNGAWRVWRNMLDHHAAVRDFGGTGANFYRAYYAAHPELGALGGGGAFGGLGLDSDFIENMLAPGSWISAWLGIESNEPGVLRIAPSRPPALDEMGVRSLVYRGNRLDVRHVAGVIDLRGSTLRAGASETLEIFFRGAWPPNAVVLRDGELAPGSATWSPDGLTLRTPIAASSFEVRAN